MEIGFISRLHKNSRSQEEKKDRTSRKVGKKGYIENGT